MWLLALQTCWTCKNMTERQAIQEQNNAIVEVSFLFSLFFFKNKPNRLVVTLIVTPWVSSQHGDWHVWNIFSISTRTNLWTLHRLPPLGWAFKSHLQDYLLTVIKMLDKKARLSAVGRFDGTQHWICKRSYCFVCVRFVKDEMRLRIISCIVVILRFIFCRRCLWLGTSWISLCINGSGEF